MANIIFINLDKAREAEVTQLTRDTISAAATKAGLERIYITSARRLPTEQAEAMYHNIVVKKRIIRYREPGRKVTELCQQLHKQGVGKETIIKRMTALIIDLANNNQRVSLHCVSEEGYAQKNVIDISQSIPLEMARRFILSLAEQNTTSRIIQSVSSSICANKVSFDASEPAIHIEINQTV